MRVGAGEKVRERSGAGVGGAAGMASSAVPEGTSTPVQRRLSRTYTTGALTELFDSEVVPSSLASIAPILRVANEIEAARPRVAYLCTCNHCHT